MFSALHKMRSFAGCITRLHIPSNIKISRSYPTTGQAPAATSYKAAILEEFNKPLIVSNVKNDSPLGSEMIKMAVHFCCLNITDVNKLICDKNDDLLLPTIPGCEFSGEILEVGDYVTENLKKGDKVVALLEHDHQIGGGLAEQSVVSELDCFQIGSVSLKDAALLINGHGTALLAFTKYCELQENDIVIVIAGPGGNGLAAIQLAKNVFKAKVYVICDTEDTSALIRAEGAHKSVSVNVGLSKVYSFLETSMKETKAKCVYDACGGGLMYVAADFVDPENGHFLTIDPTYNFDTFPASRPEFKKTKKAAATTDDNSDVDTFVTKIKRVDLYKYRDLDKEFYRQTIADTLALCEEEIITPYVSRTFGLSEVNDAVKFIKEKKCTGKVLIDIRQQDVIESDDESKTK